MEFAGRLLGESPRWFKMALGFLERSYPEALASKTKACSRLRS